MSILRNLAKEVVQDSALSSLESIAVSLAKIANIAERFAAAYNLPMPELPFDMREVSMDEETAFIMTDEREQLIQEQIQRRTVGGVDVSNLI